MSNNQFFYSGQTRRFISQFIRLMSGFQVEFGQNNNGVTALQTVPVFYGDPSRQVSQIIKGNSENTLNTVPAIAVYLSGFEYDRARVQNPTFVGKLNIRERVYDPVTGTYGDGQGNAFTIERIMPVPYKLTLKVDIWTSNTNQKLQLLEQILPLMNPSLEIQSTDNYVDWTSLTVVYLTGSTWSSRTVPAGPTSAIDVATLTFELPIWISLPAKVKKLGVIERIITNIFDANGDLIDELANKPVTDLLSQKTLTPLNYSVIYFNNTLQLFRNNDIVTDTLQNITVNETGDQYSWLELITVYGATLQNGISTIQLTQDSGVTIVGTVSYHPTDATKLLFSPFANTLPANTLPPINAIIDPYGATIDSIISSATAGVTYLILNGIGSVNNAPTNVAPAWGGLIANANDIITFNGTTWSVAFSSELATSVQYCTNLTSGIQYKWTPATQSWSKAVEGEYSPENWTIVLS